jgi:RNA polymerase sigma-70 factor (ECF subfamily)
MESVYRDRYGRFRDVLSSLTGSRELAADAVQETFAQALRDRHSFRGEGSLKGWIWRIAVRTAGRQRATYGASVGLQEFSTNGSAPAPAWSDVDPELADAVRSLPPRQRLMVFLHYFADLRDAVGR